MTQESEPRQLVLIIVISVCLSATISCSHNAQPAAATGSNVKHYQLTGRVVAIDKPNKSLTVDGDDIPGFMSAMQMPYDVKDPTLLDKLSPGDKIIADVVVKNDESWLENIKVSQPAPPAPKPASHLHVAEASAA